jgi:hypothetical protein
MFCSYCGAPATESARYCASCGQEIYRGPAFARPPALTVLAILQFVGAAICLFLGIVILSIGVIGQRGAWAAVGGLLLVGFAAAQFFCGAGLWNLKPYGRSLLMVFAAFGLLAFPVGTVISVVLLMYFRQPGIRLVLSGRLPETLSPDERLQVEEISYGGTVVWVAAALIVLLIGGSLVVVALPGLTDSRRSAEEGMAAETVRTLLIAERAYATANHGLFGPPECLAKPFDCGVALKGVWLVEGGLPWVFEREGYVFRFTAPTSERRLESFLILAAPTSGGGGRWLCGDRTGVVRAGVGALQVTAPACPAHWSVIK